LAIALLFMTAAAWLVVSTVAMNRRREQRAIRHATFVDAGRTVARQIRSTGTIPRTLDDLRSAGWLSDSQWAFCRSNGVTYTAPQAGSSNDQVILRMHCEGDLVVYLSGLAEWEDRGSAGPDSEQKK